MTSFYFNHSPLLMVHNVCMRLLALGLAQVGSAMAGRVLLAALVAMLMGCASLPGEVQRPPSQARTDVQATRLAAVAGASLPDGSRPLSGVRLLPAGDQAFEALIALARAADQTIDAQYYLVADDASGLQLLRELRDAAARGVRVRLLVDDLDAAGEDVLLAGLAAHPNIEVRMFNPLPVRSGSVGTRVLFSLHEFSRINRRMHNKLFVADNLFAVSGGRNIADAYFDRSAPANFIDMDLLSTGPVVRELSKVFDRYWNSEHAYPIQSLAGPGLGADAARRQFDAALQQAGAAELPPVARDVFGQGGVGAQLAGGRVALHAASVRVIADGPGKAAAASARSAAAGAVMNGNLELLQSARSEVLVASPYFVPDERTLDVLRQASAEGVRVSIMTNSLATTDAPLVHFGYARYRDALLRMKVALYELMPGAGRQDDSAGEWHGSLGRLHAKLAVVDQRWLYIGSMNMDHRSAHCNTEIGLIVDSPELAGEVASLLEREQLSRSYRVRLVSEPRRLQWVAQEGEKQVVLRTEPVLNWGRQLRLSVLSMFVSEDLL
jgi:putative cardiolipin synthase